MVQHPTADAPVVRVSRRADRQQFHDGRLNVAEIGAAMARSELLRLAARPFSCGVVVRQPLAHRGQSVVL